VRTPILSNVDLERIRRVENHVDHAFRTFTLDICYLERDGAAGMEAALERLFDQATEVVVKGYNILILSDRGLCADRIAIPALLATAGVHHHLIRKGLRTEVGLVVETGEARQVHDFCLLAGYGAEAINPYLAFDTLSNLRHNVASADLDEAETHKRYIKAICKGILKVMSKMGISTYQSYCGAQIFDAIGLSDAFVEKYFTGTHTPVGGIGLPEVAEEAVRRHRLAFGDAPLYKNALDVGGEVQFRLRGEEHMWTPETVAMLQHAVRSGDYHRFKAYSQRINDHNVKLKNLRGLFEFKPAEPIALDEVEPVSAIVKRFATGAMSFGSISYEAHTTLAIAMNRLGGKSNTGEGGEEAERFKPLPNGDLIRSAIKQVASGRFGVTAEYLVNADDIQIKIAQGAKPGEGGQLPGHKVDEWIARVRHSTPGVGLISPPPHHDIYSIEDLAQLVFDLKQVNPEAAVSVKLVAEQGVGTVAVGVTKALADVVHIAGADGGTGASPLSSIKNAGLPWEIGLVEAQHELAESGLRSRVRLRIDGGLKTGRDVMVAALLGADEFSFGTAALLAEGCLMVRTCHLDTCPVGIATQRPELRVKFAGTPEMVAAFMMAVAEEMRGYLACVGARTLDEVIGRVEHLRIRDADDPPGRLDLFPLIRKPRGDRRFTGVGVVARPVSTLGDRVFDAAWPAIERGDRVDLEYPIANTDRTVGARLGGAIGRRFGEAFPPGSATSTFDGAAGQSFGAFLAHGVYFRLRGEANDYVGKGMGGGRIVIVPPEGDAGDPWLVGNTVLYGATGGELFVAGRAGERFGVRNSGATAVVEGVGDHAAEYMTGGTIVVLGPVGENLAAGMTGGEVFIHDPGVRVADRMDHELVEPRELDGEALDRLHLLLERHHSLTGSARAASILGDWDGRRREFLHVVPRPGPDLEVIVRLQEGTVSSDPMAGSDVSSAVATVTGS
ncbi:MAG: glutamate synthase large subunit, partial [Actinomycetota bacterium]